MFHALLYSGHTQIPVPQDFPCITFSPFVLRSPDYSHLPDQGQLDRVETEPPGTGMTDTHRIHWLFFLLCCAQCVGSASFTCQNSPGIPKVMEHHLVPNSVRQKQLNGKRGGKEMASHCAHRCP